jgi:hypothetical protein
MSMYGDGTHNVSSEEGHDRSDADIIRSANSQIISENCNISIFR